MDQLSMPEQQDLIKDVEQTIRLTHDGLSPNEALTKIASERKLGPEMIRRAAEAFNKSKSVHVFKTAGEGERAKPFDLVDPSVVIGNIFKPVEKQASAFALPEGHFDGIDFNFSDSVLEKRASEEADKGFKREPTSDELKTLDRLAKQAGIEHAQFCNRMRQELGLKVQEHKYAFDKALDTVVGCAQTMSDQQFEKMARRIVTGYPTTGPGLVAIISHKIRKAMPENLEKMANAFVYRAKEPYLSVAKLYDAAEKMAAAEIEMNMFEKKAAEPFLGSVAANTIANMLAGMGLSPDEMQELMGSKKKFKHVEEDLDPDFYNRMKAHDAKRTFMMLSLYDADLKQYDQKQLMQAYNDSVQSVPEAFDKPSILKNLMIRNLQSSGIKDPFEMKQEQEISKQLRERNKYSENKVLEEKLRLEALKDKDKPTIRAVSMQGPVGIRNALFGGVERQGKIISEGARSWGKSREEKRKNDAKAPKTQQAPSIDSLVDKDLQFLKGSIGRSGSPLADIRNALRSYHAQQGLTNDENKILQNLGYIQ